MKPTPLLNLFSGLILFTVSILFCDTAKSQIKAQFSSDIVSGCSPLIIKFTDKSTGSPTFWKWDLGNGTISFQQNPSATYFATGTYTVKLIVQNATSSDTIIKQKYISVQGQPVVNFQGSPQTGCYPLPVQFTDESISPSGNIRSWEWDFGDGMLSNLPNPKHTYTGGGNFNVSLRITNTAGCFKTLTKNNYVKISSGVKASFTNSTPAVCTPPAIVNFTNSSTGTGNLSYLWDFGDSSFSATPNPSHTYLKKGLYTVSLIVVSSQGCTDSFRKSNTIDLQSIKTDFSYPSPVCQGSSVIFINSSSPVPVSSTWFFDTSKTGSTLANPSRKYDSVGIYKVKLVTQFSTCTDSVTKNIIVQIKPHANFSADQTISCKTPARVSFTSLSLGASSYLWKFGDGALSNLANPIHVYDSIGSYTVSLIVTNTAGCSDTISKLNYINIAPPKITIPNLPVSGCLPYTNIFQSVIQSADSVISYRWNFGDSIFSNLKAPSHTYYKAGVYNIGLSIITSTGCKDSVTVLKAVAAGGRLHSTFAAEPTNVCAFVPINFSDSTKRSATDSLIIPDQWLWSFGDGNFSTDKNPIHLYHDTGSFNISLIVYNLGCADTTLIKNYITINAPVSKFDLTYDCSDRFSRSFINRSDGADTFIWDFGDGSTSVIQNPVHHYLSPGSYTVSLRVNNKKSGCENTLKITVPIINEKANFIADQTEICRSLSVNFITSGLNFINIKNIVWNFGDGVVTSSNSTAISHTYQVAGIYNVSLVVTDNLGCSDTLLKPTYITVNSPKANFSTPISGCANSPIVFSDSSKDDGIHPIKNWEWNFGDAANNVRNFTKGPFTNNYQNAGNFTIQLKVTDVNGCSDSLLKVNAIHISKPIANFSAPTLSCSNAGLAFKDLSSDTIKNYLWNFGDGTISTDPNPLHRYRLEATYNVSLKVIDNYGCKDSINKNGFVIIANPVATFAVSDSFSNCPPLVVTFTNNSKNGISYSWDFGDGNNSVLKNPSHFYSTAGIYTVTLKVTSEGACEDIAFKKIIIKGPSGNFTYNHLFGCAPFISNFSANVKNTSSLFWDFNDGVTNSTTIPAIDHSYQTSGSFIPKLILMDNAGCKVPLIGVDTINVYDVKANFGINKLQFCDSLRNFFTDSTIANDLVTSYNWTFGDGQFGNTQDITHTYNTSGSYKVALHVQSLEGCSSTIEKTFFMDLIKTPVANFIAKKEACANDMITTNALLSNANSHQVNYVWDFGNDITSTGQNPPSIKYSIAGDYNITLITSREGGCNDTVIKTITIHPIPALNIQSQNTVCKGNTHVLATTGADTYNWSPAMGLSCTTCSAPSYVPNTDITYFVNGKNTFGCQAFDSIKIRVLQPFSMKVGNPDSLCVGNNVQLNATGAVSYTWSPTQGLNNPNIASPVAHPLTTTNYMVIGNNNEPCFKDTGYVLVTVFPIPVVNAGSDKNIKAGASIQLVPTISNDVINVHWTPTVGITGSTYPAITVKPSQTTEYTIEAINGGSCRTRDKVTVFVLCDNANVFIPNTFSPNGDGANEVFYPRGSGIFSIRSFRIFNRWGELVFQQSDIKANDSSKGWDGSYKGVKLSPDVFIYIMEVVCENGTPLTYKGNIALIK